MRFPVPSRVDDKPKSKDTMAEPKVKQKNTNTDPATSSDGGSWKVDAKGQLVAHITPQVTFGIVFDNTKISNAALDLGVDAYTRLYAEAKVGSEKDFVYCYGADSIAELFANVEAPTIFSSPHRNHWPLCHKPVVFIEKTCSDGSKD